MADVGRRWQQPRFALCPNFGPWSFATRSFRSPAGAGTTEGEGAATDRGAASVAGGVAAMALATKKVLFVAGCCRMFQGRAKCEGCPNLEKTAGNVLECEKEIRNGLKWRFSML